MRPDFLPLNSYEVTYILHTHLPHMETAEESRPTEKQRSSKHLIDDDPGGHIGPQGPHLASPQEQVLSAGMGLTIQLHMMIGCVQRDRLMKENEAPNYWAQSHATDGIRPNAGGASDRPIHHSPCTLEQEVHAGGVCKGNESWIVKSLVCLEASGSRSLQSRIQMGRGLRSRGSPISISPMG